MYQCDYSNVFTAIDVATTSNRENTFLLTKSLL